MSGRVGTAAVVIVLVAVGVFLGSALSQWRTPPPDLSTRSVRPARVGERVRVEVLNGGGREGMAKSATDRLRDHGFDVVYFGNASSFDRESVVYDRVGRLELARAVADRLGIADVLSEPDSNLYLDVSVVLGEGWVAPLDSTRSVERPWWDVRRFLPERDDGDEEARPDSAKLADPESGGG